VKRTLGKADKIRLKNEFDRIRQNGSKTVGSRMLAVCAPAPDGKLRCGVVCGKKYSLLSVERNRARRLLWESFRLLKDRVGVCHMLLIPRRRMADAKRPQVTLELSQLLVKAGLIPEELAGIPPEC